ncbi:MAG: 1-phosphofructokinase [Desemzia incerta]|uniref:Tagatose-6-phosphate kinase n=1 Tax=Desemzia incerta TaxID=82801 RepID=A0A1I5UXI4_9LACT|nr:MULTISPECIES: 1-phosphofructokinase [Desemzia]MCI3027588.1 1-phosphofructokinase [Desemzia sp. C1]SFP99918.1 fructose-1-phosphate kinase [Desemzia incerta]
MIYTVTLNPSIDYIVQLPTVQLGELNRMTGDIKLPGGKGINVSRVLNNIGQESTALGFIGGFTGRFITDWLKKEAVGTDFVEIEQDTRINVKVKADIETEINAAGPAVSEKESEQLLQQMDALTADDIVVLSGNKPPTLPEDFYQQMVKKISAAGADFVIDTTGKELMNAIGSRPLLVKPNHHELADLFETTFDSVEDIIPYGKKLIELGAKYAVISMAGDGALFFTESAAYRATVPKGQVKNSVGAGDSMIAGFIGALVSTKDPLEAFKKSVATGSATAFSDDLATKEAIEALVEQVEIKKID